MGGMGLSGMASTNCNDWLTARGSGVPGFSSVFPLLPQPAAQLPSGPASSSSQNTAKNALC